MEKRPSSMGECGGSDWVGYRSSGFAEGYCSIISIQFCQLRSVLVKIVRINLQWLKLHVFLKQQGLLWSLVQGHLISFSSTEEVVTKEVTKEILLHIRFDM